MMFSQQTNRKCKEIVGICEYELARACERETKLRKINEEYECDMLATDKEIHLNKQNKRSQYPFENRKTDWICIHYFCFACCCYNRFFFVLFNLTTKFPCRIANI